MHSNRACRVTERLSSLSLVSRFVMGLACCGSVIRDAVVGVVGVGFVVGFVVVGVAGVAFGQGFSPDESARRMVAPDGLEVRLVAAEPLVRQPILVKFDDRGRLWTIQYLQYPNPAGLKRVAVDRWSRTTYDRLPEPPPRGPRGDDRITILEDTDGDGRADRTKDFVTGLNLATGLAFGHDGVFVLQVPYLLFYPDRNRDDIPDSDPEVLLEGFGMEDAQSFANHLTWGPDGWLYGVNGSTTTCRIRGIEFQQGVWRYHPVSKKFELFCEGGGNLFGLTFDENGQLLYSSNGGYLFFHGVQGGYYQKSFGKHGPLHNPYAYGWFSDVKKNSPVPGPPSTGGTIYLGDALPAEMRGTFVCGNFLGQSVSWWRVTSQASTFVATLGGPLADARDSWCCPTDVCVGPDGAVYFCDFHDRRTAHPDPDAQWDRSNGRIYRIAPPGRSSAGAIDLAGQSDERLVELLAHPNHWFRERARILLSGRQLSADLVDRLRRQVTQPDTALHSLWTLYAVGGWNELLGREWLDHSSEHVRYWNLRWLGDQHQVTAETAARQISLARTEPSIVVRTQLAATAKRLPASEALPLIAALLDREQDDSDPFQPWLLWWAIESKATSDRAAVLDLFARSDAWTKASWRGNLRRLARRYAAEGTPEGYAACHRLLETTPAPQRPSMLTALEQGLSERASEPGDVGQGGLFERFAILPGQDPQQRKRDDRRPLAAVPDPLATDIRTAWREQPDDPLHLRLALRAGTRGALEHLYQRLRESLQKPTSPLPARDVAWLAILREFGTADEATTIAINYLTSSNPQQVKSGAIAVLDRFAAAESTEQLLRLYPALPGALRSQTRDVLASRPESALALLEQVEARQIPAADVSLDEVRRMAAHQRPEIDELIRRYWGNIRPGSTEEKLAEVRRLANDLRAGRGDPNAGRALFAKHCGVCHKLFDEGNAIGPDLTPANRTDREFLLVSLVDPSAVVRSGFLTYVLTTTRGQVLTGLIADQDAASVTLVDAKNQRTRVPRGEIEDLQPSAASLMPERIQTQLSPQELRDLFAWLERR